MNYKKKTKEGKEEVEDQKMCFTGQKMAFYASGCAQESQCPKRENL